MKNTPAELPIEQRKTEEIVEDLCLALRDVGISDYRLPKCEATVASVLRVKQLHDELSRRGADITPRLQRLSEETSWQMIPLLRDCLVYPEVIPYVRERDGIRRVLRCPNCRVREISERKGAAWLCDVCKAEAAASGFRGVMRVRINPAAFDELHLHPPFEAILLREIPGQGYWVAELPKPIRWSRGRRAKAFASYLILEPRWMGTKLGKGMRDMPVNISCVMDDNFFADECFDLSKCRSLGSGIVTDISSNHLTTANTRPRGSFVHWLKVLFRG